MTNEELKKIFDKYNVPTSNPFFFELASSLEQEPCEDCISREYILSKAHECRDDLADDEPCCVDADDIREAPSVQPKAKVGHWSHDGSHWAERWICSECNYKLIDVKSRYCPNCGAKMESEDKE